MKYHVRARANITVDFEIEADSDYQAESRVEDYLRYVKGGKLPQDISIKTQDGDKLTSVFVMEKSVEDCYEL